ncbi:type IV toxin-antitoxin system AbiEi family antitoxin domain-containing protein [Selenihalanaerobacter shriftii]|uniref:Transcriptional regulator, AbiEi antitoxin, Type IV TA system n=1 Tax=Selenihalanaerobacter shriftii TaxID=142842 RepID=A0A1T4RAF3_9FIRM|nr:type IV toxin-antitoxin system AbiEi family antitoxin domain-containing protein [Selenihalanaerobacter shriftii]SKA13002.1 Transcriptional regulator, AbiEi antitoxin, Type IV TA system [Selenihalanaerobacter shriftii]
MKKEHQRIENIFKKNGGYARTKDIINSGIHSHYLYELVEEGIVNKVKTGLYFWDNGDIDYLKNGFVKANEIVPKGVICLLSALSYYEITTYNHFEYYIAIHRKDRKPVLPDYPPIKVLYFSEKQFQIGIKEVKLNNNVIRIYDLEKTICDCLKFKDRVGMDIVKEVLNEYVKKQDRDIDKLLDYAEEIGVLDIAKTYLEVLI